MPNYQNSKQKQYLINQHLNNLTLNEEVIVKRGTLTNGDYRKNDDIKCTVYNLRSDEFVDVAWKEYTKTKIIAVKKSDINKSTYNIGANPFPSDNSSKLRNLNYMLESIIYDVIERDRKERYEIVAGVKVVEMNWNPYVTINNEKKYYQRDFVWSLKDKQNLIDSIYNNIECGKIIVRNREWSTVEKLVKSGITNVSFKDIVDGKQRLNAILGFVNNEFIDSYGNYWCDLSDKAQNKFLSAQLFSYCYLGDDASDEDVLNQFLKTNFAGVQQSIEHIEFVKSLYNDIKIK